MRARRVFRPAWLAPTLLLCAAGAAIAGDLPRDAGPGIPTTQTRAGTDPAAVEAASATESVTFTVDAPVPVRSGTEIVDAFLGGLSDDACGSGEASARWRKHFAASPRRLAESDDTLALFGYVVDALREVHLPTEYALIPFVESGYAPGARSQGGPAGMWQFIALTARNHKIPVRAGYDGRMSPVASTRAAVRYLRTLHGMFAGDWRLAAMAFNAGEYRILGALRRSGMAAASAEPSRLAGLSGITYAYPRKMHALSCLLQEAGRREDWRAALDRPVPRLEAVELPADVRDLDAWGRARGLDMAYVRRLNPAWTGRHVPRRAGETLRVLVPAGRVAASASLDASTVAGSAEPAPAPGTDANPDPRTHVVRNGDSLWTIAREHGVSLDQLRALNTIGRKSVLQPGMILRIDAASTDGR